jgi:hypothetical protein
VYVHLTGEICLPHGSDSVRGFIRPFRIGFQDVGYSTVQPTKLCLKFLDLRVARFRSHEACQFIQITQGENDKPALGRAWAVWTGALAAFAEVLGDRSPAIRKGRVLIEADLVSEKRPCDGR